MRKNTGTAPPARGTPVGKARGMPNVRGTPLIKLRDGPIARARGKPPFVNIANGGVPGCFSPAFVFWECRNAYPDSTRLIGTDRPRKRAYRMHESKDLFKQGKNLKWEWYGFTCIVKVVRLNEVADLSVNAVKSKDVDRLEEDADLSAFAAPDNVGYEIKTNVGYEINNNIGYGKENKVVIFNADSACPEYTESKNVDRLEETVESLNGFTRSKLGLTNTAQDTVQDTAQVQDLIINLDEEMTREEIQKKLGLTHREYFRKFYLLPALEKGFIEMTLPDKPNSRYQKYRLTEKGKLTRNG